jgi:hypothetical protein
LLAIPAQAGPRRQDAAADIGVADGPKGALQEAVHHAVAVWPGQAWPLLDDQTFVC